MKRPAIPEIFREWIPGDPSPAYLLYGGGCGLAGLLAKAWERQLRTGVEGAVEVHKWTVEDLGKESPEAAWRSPSFFSRWRIFLRPDLAVMRKKDRDSIRGYLASPEPTSMLILHGTDFRQARTFSSVANLLSSAPTENQAVGELARYAAGTAAEAGVRMSRETALFLARWVGGSFDALETELSKVLAYAAERGEVSEEDVRTVCVSRGAVDPFRLAEALVKKDRATCLSLFRRFAAAADPEDYHKLNGAVAWYLRSRIQGKGETVSEERAQVIFRALSRIDCDMKGDSRLSPGQVYEIRLLSMLL